MRNIWVILFQIYIIKIDFLKTFFFGIFKEKKTTPISFFRLFYDLSYLKFLDIQKYADFRKLVSWWKCTT